jgi:hypothetical protein
VLVGQVPVPVVELQPVPGLHVPLNDRNENVDALMHVRSVRCVHAVVRMVQPLVLQPRVGATSLVPLQVMGSVLHATGACGTPSGRQRVASAGSHAGAAPVYTPVPPKLTHCPAGVGQSDTTGRPLAKQRVPFSQSPT